MVDGWRREQWVHTAELKATILNSQLDGRKRKPYTYRDFYPFPLPKKNADVPKAPISVLKAAFVDRGVQQHLGQDVTDVISRRNPSG